MAEPVRCRKCVSLGVLVLLLVAFAAFRAGGYPARYGFGLSLSDYNTMAATNVAQGYRPISLDANGPTNSPHIAAVWINDGFTNWTTVVGATESSYSGQVSTLESQGYRCLTVDAYGDPSAQCYVAIWVRDSYATNKSAEVHGVTESQFNTDWNYYYNAGYRPDWISVNGTNGSPTFSGTWVDDGKGYWTYWNIGNLPGTVTNLWEDGGRPTALTGYGPSTSRLFAGNWIYAEQPVWTWNYQMTAAQFQTAATNLTAQGYRPSFITENGDTSAPFYCASWVQDPAASVWTITGASNAAAAAVDTEMTNYMAQRFITRGAVAVTLHGRLVFHHAYTYAPTNVAPTQPTNLFRIASLSKAFTSAAIMQLIQAGKVGIDQQIGTILNLSGATDSRFATVTIREMLQHWGGWDRSISPDPMFNDFAVSAGTGMPLPTTPQMIINYMKTQSLDHAPGTVYAYSNFGYCLLGRVIEAVTGVPYGQWIQANVLQPAGIWDMQLGKPLLTDKLPAEVDYDDQLQRIEPTVMGAGSPPFPPIQYGGWNIKSMDSHGGWLATAADLVRFSSSYDNQANSPLMNSNMFNLMVSIPPYPAQDQNAAAYYGAGWMVRPEGGNTYNLWHDGSLDGTFTYSVRLANGICWATVFNRRDVIGDLPNYENIDGEMNAAVASVPSWPSYNLFDSNNDGLLDAWQIYYFGSINSPSAAPNADPDHDGVNNLNEFINMTDPTDASSVARLQAIALAPQSVVLGWNAARGRMYTLLKTGSLSSPNWQPIATGIIGDNTAHTFTNSPATGFYRLSTSLQRQN